MRLVAWNANHNRRRRSLDANVALMEPFGADILVLSETAGPRSKPSDVHWIGGLDPGLAVVAPKGLKLLPHPGNFAAETHMGAFTASGQVTFNLLALWPVQRRVSSYHHILMSALDRYADFLVADRVIMAGDLNSTSRVSSQRASHPLFVKRAQELGLVSAYHEQTGEGHGDETVATYLHNCDSTRGFHIDYCFITNALKASAKLLIKNDAEWAARSDHFPLVLDVDDGVLRPPPPR